MAGRNCVVAGTEGFVEAEGEYRFYAEDQPGEWRIDLTGGLRPLPRLCVAAELHFDFQWQSVRACVLDQTATKS